MSQDSTLLPNVDNPPGQASVIGDNTGTALDYSSHLDRVVTALEQMALSLALIYDKIDNISEKTDIIAASQASITSSQSTIADRQTTIANQQTIIANKQALIETYQKRLKELSEGSGHHIVGPYEWLSMAAIYRIFVEQGVDFASIKQQIDSLPKEEGF
jgi:hypothetical protein